MLVDAGAEYFGYTADISRTWPVSGKFTDGQRALYEAVCSRSFLSLTFTGVGDAEGMHRADEEERHDDV